LLRGFPGPRKVPSSPTSNVPSLPHFARNASATLCKSRRSRTQPAGADELRGTGRSNTSFVSHLDAYLAEARGHLARAQQQPDSWPFCGSALACALEYGACAVFIAWDEPYKADRRMHRHFDERLAPLLDPPVPPVVDGIWACEGSGKPEDVKAFIAAFQQVISIFTELATNAPLPGWQVRPVPPPVGRDALSDAERSFLRTALAAAREAGIQVRMLLFGVARGGNGPARQ
jgi:hypothetical protein